MASNEDLSWRTPAFRQSVVNKIDEAIQRSGMPTARNSREMESHVFQKANTKEEYLGFVARLILHVREMNSKKAAMGAAGGPGAPMPNVAGMAQDPINALQTLARQGTANAHMVVTMPGQGPPMPQPGQPGQPQQMPPGMMMGMGGGPGMVPGPPMGQPQQPGQQMPPGMMQTQAQQPQQQPQMSASGLLQSLGQRPGMPGMQGMPRQMPGPGGMMAGMGGYPGQNPQMAQHMAQLQQQQQQQQAAAAAAAAAAAQRKQAEAMGMVPGGPGPGQYHPRPGGAGTPNQPFLGQSPNPNPASVPSPAGPMGGMPGSQMAASPAMVPSPSPQISGPPGSVGQQRSVGMAPSPSSSLNTPGMGGGATPSPCSLQEEQAYREKVRQLSKYIEPLQRMIARMGSEDVEKHSKMKKLLEILSNPSKRMPLETLIKCEVVLEKLDFKRSDGASFAPPSAGPLNVLKEHQPYNPVMEALGNQLHSPFINHTLQRTFGPTLEALLGPEIKLPASVHKPPKTQEPSDEIAEVLQGEIARLDQRFKVSLNPTQHPGSNSVHLICWLDDRHLPCVPPICITVPDDYPASPPKCDLAANEYGSTTFLTAVQKALAARIHKLPSKYSVSQVLDTWEMAVRQASSPAQQATQVNSMTVLMGL